MRLGAKRLPILADRGSSSALRRKGIDGIVKISGAGQIFPLPARGQAGRPSEAQAGRSSKFSPDKFSPERHRDLAELAPEAQISTGPG